ncbi:MAG: TldD/PmbA family protein [Pseudonocardia sp.]|nr:TldD/PmbA family protein [Pseudonocardia sp.]
MGILSSSELVERALEIPGKDTVGRVVLATESSEVALRWANSTMTTNGHSTVVSWTVISLVRLGDAPGAVGTGVVSSSALVTDLAQIQDAVIASEAVARQAGPARDVIGLPEPSDENGVGWAEPAGQTSIKVFDRLAEQLGEAFASARGGHLMPRVLYGFASHEVATTWLGTSAGVRRRWVQPIGSVELNAKSADLTRSAWAGRSVATPEDFAALDVIGLDAELVDRLGWGQRRVELPAGRYPTILPPAAVADLMIYMCWEMAGRPACEGRSAFSAPPDSGRPTRVGERLSALPLSLTSDPNAGNGLACAPFLVTTQSSDEISVFDNGARLGKVNWVAEGVLSALAYPRAAAAELGTEFAAPPSNLILTGGSDASLADLVAGTERVLLPTCLWYIRLVDPATLLLTGLTRDGVYLVERGEVVGEVNNFRFNESPLDLLRRVSAVTKTERALPREFKDEFTLTAMPSVLVPDFNMSSVSKAN